MTSVSTVPVSLGQRSYDILIKPGLLERLGERLKKLRVTGKVGVVTDRHVARYYAKDVLSELRRIDVEAVPIVLAPGEQSKTLKTIEHILDVLARHRFERASLLLALGGGVVGDLAGFAAAIYQRGIPFIQIPTTLVAQVDSSVGGKTGVDHRLGKNLIGAFYQPKAVWIDPLTLRTLPAREWVAGLAEVIKYGVIADEKFFAYLQREMSGLLRRQPDIVAAVVKRSCEIKADVVAADERESDRRRILNYGHTIGHALEALGGYESLIHGEAVGIGLVQEADLACYQGICERNVVENIRDVVRAAGLSDRMPAWPPDKIWKAMLHDKKVSHGQVVGVWPERIGAVRMGPIDKRVFHRWYTDSCSTVARNRSLRKDSLQRLK
ncbi:MAG TPA: 3-dehydroquinate synthase [Nitrospira sp.]|nr:3-dehydroquinate synthase [Nitrospira sp.]